MNVILIVSDTLRRDHLGCYGNRWMHTPHLDRLAEGGALFENCFTASFPTGPHRKDLHTGRFSFTYSPWSPLGAEEVTLAQVLSRAGYVSMLIGDTPALRHGYERGFSGHDFLRGQENDPWITDKVEVRPEASLSKLRGPRRRVEQVYRNVSRWQWEEDHSVAQVMRRAAHWLERNYQHERFFLCVDCFDPHEAWFPPEWYVQRYDHGYQGQRIRGPAYRTTGFCTARELRHMRALYAATVSLVDRWIGYLLETAEQMGLFQNSLVLVTSDHGFYLGEHGYVGKVDLRGDFTRWSLLEEMIRVPLIVRAPDAEPRRIRAFVQPPDIMPTILDFAGLRGPKAIQGKSLRRLLEGSERPLRSEAISSWTLVQDEQVRPPSTLTTREWTFVYGGDEAPHALYHRGSDPEHKRNLFTRERAVAERLHRRYIKRLRELAVPQERLALRTNLHAPRRRARGVRRML